jgi:hypothetical protein
MNSAPALVLPPLSPADQATLSTWDSCVDRASRIRSTATMALAYYGWRVKKSGRWSEFGCSNEQEYREARGISPNTWRVCMRIGQVFEAMPFEQLAVMTVTTATWFTKINPQLWHDYPWLEEAKRLQSKVFAKLVTDRNRLIDPEFGRSGRGNSAGLAIYRARLQLLKQQQELKSAEEAAMFLAADLPRSEHSQLLAASRHAYKLVGLAIKTMKRRQKKQSRYISARYTDKHLEDELRQLGKARTRLSAAILSCEKAIYDEEIDGKMALDQSAALRTIRELPQ